MKELMRLFGRQDGSASKTGMLYGAMILVLLLSVIIVGVLLIIWAAQGELTPDNARELVAQLDRPAGGAAGSSLLYNVERIAKKLLQTAKEEDAATELEEVDATDA